MRIGLVTFEYPPDTAVGGIATYMAQWAKLLQTRGHDVEVFCSSPFREGLANIEGITVNFCKTSDRASFNKIILPIFSTRQQVKPFDVVESPEIGVDAKEIKRKFPNIILVVKLHTPTFLMDELNNNRRKYPLSEKLRVTLGAWRRLKKPSRYWTKDVLVDKEEADFINSADIITSPSLSLIDIVASRFNISSKRIHHLPNPYIPANSLLQISVTSRADVITYFGRLEKRKGICVFKEVVPKIVSKYPHFLFRFVGRDTTLLPERISAKQMLLENLKGFENNVEFVEHVTLEEIPGILKDTRICIFPSLWENFPTVCLEAMSAGRAIVGSKEGGMKDMLEEPQAGKLLDPLDINEIVATLSSLIESEELCRQLGAQARASVLQKYNAEVIGSKFEKLVEPLLV